MRIIINRKSITLVLVDVILFRIIQQPGSLKYIISMIIILTLLFFKEKKLKLNTNIYLLIPWLFVGIYGGIIGYWNNSLTTNGIRLLILYTIPFVLAYFYCDIFYMQLEHLIFCQFIALLIVFIMYGIKNYTSTNLLESSYAFIFGIYVIFFVYKRKYCWAIIASIAFILADKRIAMIAALIVLIYVVVSQKIKKDSIQDKFILLVSILCIGMVFLYLYFIFTGILERYSLMYNINTMGRLNMYNIIKRGIPFSVKYWGHGLGYTLDVLGRIGNVHFELLHNDFLQLYIDIGFIGVLVFAVMFWLSWKKVIDKKCSNNQKNFIIAACIYSWILFTTDNVSIYINYWFPLYIMVFSFTEENDNKKGALKREKTNRNL